MAIPASIAALYESGDAWLADCSAHPDLVRAAWDKEVLAPIPAGRRWLCAETRLLTAMQTQSRIADRLRGPLLADTVADVAWWLIPLEAADELADVRQLRVRELGWCLKCPPTGWQTDGRFWLTRPDGSGHLTDPAVVVTALGPSRRRIPRAEAS